MNETIFKTIPQNDDFIIPFELSKKPLAAWLLTLSKYGGREACLQILNLLQALNKIKIPAKSRIGFLTIISDYLTQYISLLECNSCSGFPLSKQEQECAELITWNRLTLGKSFFIAAQSASTRDEEVFALYMASCSLAEAQLQMATIYAIPCDEFWKLVYKIFGRAEKRKLLTLEMDDPDLKSMTININFAKILIFHICDMRQFHPREMQTISHILYKACDNLFFYKLTDIQFQTDILEISRLTAINSITYTFDYLLQQLSSKLMVRTDLFMIDLAKDAPPVNNNANLDNITATTRYFCPMLVAKNLYSLVEKDNIWGGVLRSINNELLLRVARFLEPGQKRKYNRFKENKSLLGIVGLDSIISFLYKTAPKKSIAGTEPENASPTFSTYDTLKSYADELKKNTVLLNDAYGDFDLGYDFRPPETMPNNIWHDDEYLLTAPNKKVILKKITILDSSMKGYSVYWDEYAESKAKIGDILGIISEDKTRLEIALIRRVAMIAGNDFIFGSEILGFTSEIVYMNHADTDSDYEENGEWAIFIPGSEKLEQGDSLIFNASGFKVGDIIYLHRSDNVTMCLLMKDLHSESTFSHIELKY